jgi:hypothetical protein
VQRVLVVLGKRAAFSLSRVSLLCFAAHLLRFMISNLWWQNGPISFGNQPDVSSDEDDGMDEEPRFNNDPDADGSLSP